MKYSCTLLLVFGLPNSPEYTIAMSNLSSNSISTSSSLPSSSSANILTGSSGAARAASSSLATSSTVLSSGMASSAATSSLAASSSVAGVGTLTVSFTHVDNYGAQSPRNVYAVWITDASGKWIANLGERGLFQYPYLRVYKKTPVKGVDGVSGATASSFSAFTGTWNAATAPAGNYSLHMEFTTDNVSGPHDVVAFSTANGIFDVTTTKITYHMNVRLQLK